jgi:MFS family permease
VTEITAERSEARRRLPGAADFWRLWLIGLIVFTVRWIEMLVFAVFAYQVTGSAFIVTMLTMLRMLPLALFGAFMGAVADRFDRRRALLVMPVILFAISMAAMMLAWAGRLEVWHLMALAFVNGMAWASDNAIRRVMIGDVVGGDGMATAMALDTGANNASRMLGPRSVVRYLRRGVQPRRSRPVLGFMPSPSAWRSAFTIAIMSGPRLRYLCSA